MFPEMEPNDRDYVDPGQGIWALSKDLTLPLTNSITSLRLAKNVENSYMANLKKVYPFVEAGQKTSAINQLNAFIHKVQQDIRHGNISSSDGGDLIEWANLLISIIQG